MGGNAGDVHIGDTYVNDPPPTPPDPAIQAQIRYLQQLGQRCNALPLASLGHERVGPDTVGLKDVYIDLDTTKMVDIDEEEAEPGRKKQRPLSALSAVTDTPYIALLGDPGSGKSSFVYHLAGLLAQAQLGQAPLPEAWQPTLPVLLVLRDLAHHLNKVEITPTLSAEEQRRAWVTAVEQQWLADLTQCGAELFAPALKSHLEQGNALLIFDGLDELPHHLRGRVHSAVKALLATYTQLQRVIVTCRSRSYVGDTQLSGFATTTLAPFNEEKIRAFITNWYGSKKELTPSIAEGRTTNLYQATTNPELRPLAQNPMLLTTMAIIHQRDTVLPRERVRLYAQAVEVLLHRWQDHKGIPITEALRAVLADSRRLQGILQRLGYEAHRLQAEQKEADLDRGTLLRLLEEPIYLDDAGLAAHFLDYVDQRAGLLVGRGGDLAGRKPQQYRFPHRTFQEYLAGCYLVSNPSSRAALLASSRRRRLLVSRHPTRG